MGTWKMGTVTRFRTGVGVDIRPCGKWVAVPSFRPPALLRLRRLPLRAQAGGDWAAGKGAGEAPATASPSSTPRAEPSQEP